MSIRAQIIPLDAELKLHEITNDVAKKFWMNFSPIPVKKAPWLTADLFNANQFRPNAERNFSFHDIRNIYRRNLGFICRQEIKLDQITPFPIRFRLGSLEQVNRLESKPNAVRAD